MKKFFTILSIAFFAVNLYCQCPTFPNCPLAVEMLYFNSQAVKGGVKLSWATASEVNSSHFLLEKSSDAVTWTELAEIKTFNKPTHYEYDDLSNISAYYRLSEIGTDGKTEVFRAIYVERFAAKLEVFPNPSSGSITISSKNNVEIFDVLGRLVRNTVQGETRIPNMSKGIYTAKSGSETVRLIVQ